MTKWKVEELWNESQCVTYYKIYKLKDPLYADVKENRGYHPSVYFSRITAQGVADEFNKSIGGTDL